MNKKQFNAATTKFPGLLVAPLSIHEFIPSSKDAEKCEKCGKMRALHVVPEFK